jgi:hypothetical protein
LHLKVMYKYSPFTDETSAMIVACDRLADDYYAIVTAWLVGGRLNDSRPACLAAALVYKQALSLQIEYLSDCFDLELGRKRAQVCRELLSMLENDIRYLSDTRRGPGIPSLGASPVSYAEH